MNKENMAEILKLLTESDRVCKAPEFERAGTKIILPEKMGYAEAIDHLKKKVKEEETEVSVREEIDAFPLDGAYMLMRVLQDLYGWASPVPTPGLFGPNPPTMMSLEIRPGVYTQIFWGGFAMPGIEGQLNCGADFKDGRMVFVIQGNVKKKNEADLRHVASEVRRRIRTESIYLGQAIRLTTNEHGDIEADMAPKFIDTTQVREEELVLPKTVEEEVATSIYAPIEKTALCRKHRVPLKMGVLLEGPYGTGKTLTAYVTAKKCVQNGWSFIYLDRVGALKQAIQFAKPYMPAVIFAEDIDRAVEGEERTADIDDVLNTIDGIEAKNTEVMVVLTTNHVEKINRAMLRPGRLDAVISIMAPDREAAEKLVRIYGKNLVVPGPLPEASLELDGQIPAVIREVVERAKRRAIWRLHSEDEPFQLTDHDLAQAARSMKHHLGLMKPQAVPPLSPEEAQGKYLKGLIVAGVTSAVRELTFNGKSAGGKIQLAAQ